MLISIYLLITTRRIRNKETRAGDVCKLQEGCRIGTIHDLNDLYASEFVSTRDVKGFICNVKDKSTHIKSFDAELALRLANSSCLKQKKLVNTFDLRFPSSLEAKLDEKFNLKGILEFQGTLSSKFLFQLTNVGGFNANLDIKIENSNIKSINLVLIKTKVEFFMNEKQVKSCQDLLSTPMTSSWSVNSIFQLKANNAFVELLFFKCRFKYIEIFNLKMYKLIHI